MFGFLRRKKEKSEVISKTDAEISVESAKQVSDSAPEVNAPPAPSNVKSGASFTPAGARPTAAPR